MDKLYYLLYLWQLCVITTLITSSYLDLPIKKHLIFCSRMFELFIHENLIFKGNNMNR